MFDKNKIKEELKNKNLVVNKHPEAELYIYNYSRSCQYERNWNETTLNCRGLILDGDYNVVARPFSKFFNYEEHLNESVKDKIPKIPNLPFKIFKKLDGSLGILYWLKDKPYIASRGSFNSDYSEHANKILYKKHSDKFNFLKKDATYLFEMIFPYNRIVLDYGNKDDIVLLAVIDNITGKDYDINNPEINVGFEITKQYKELEGKTFEELQKLNISNEEGFVLLYENGFRLKIKFKDYIRNHSILTNVSKKRIWKDLRNKGSLEEIIKDIPDETFDWVREEIKNLKKEYKELEVFLLNTYNKIEDDLIEVPYETYKKEFVSTVFKNKETKKIANLLFAIFDDKVYSDMIWKQIEPKGETK